MVDILPTLCTLFAVCSHPQDDKSNGTQFLLTTAIFLLPILLYGLGPHVKSFSTKYRTSVALFCIGLFIYLLERNVLPLVICTITCAVIFLSNIAGDKWIRETSRPKRILGISVPNVFGSNRFVRIALRVGIVVYASALIAPYAWKELGEISRTAKKHSALAVFTLPARPHSDRIGPNPSSPEIEELQWNMFSATRNALQETFSPLANIVLIRPTVKDRDEYRSIVYAFSGRDSDRPALIENISSEVIESNAAKFLVLASIHESDLPDDSEILYIFKLYMYTDVRHANGKPKLRVVSERPRYLQAFDGEFGRVARVSIASYTEEMMDIAKFNEKQREDVWKNVTTMFRDYYMEDHTRQYRNSTWSGHKLYNDVNCTSRDCAKQWIEAYSEAADLDTEYIPINQRFLMNFSSAKLIERSLQDDCNREKERECQ